MVIQYITQFFTGFIVALTQDWKLTLVLLAIIPFLVISMAVVGKVRGRGIGNREWRRGGEKRRG